MREDGGVGGATMALQRAAVEQKFNTDWSGKMPNLRLKSLNF